MRVSDDLRQGTSLFLAEVRRLKATYDLTGGERPLLFLLDEILQGTNSHERRLGARAVVAALRDRGAIGLVSTHDLALAAPDAHESRPLACVHFTDEEHDGEMRFDYRMRPGVSTTTNALRVMAAQGLPVGPDASTARNVS